MEDPAAAADSMAEVADSTAAADFMEEGGFMAAADFMLAADFVAVAASSPDRVARVHFRGQREAIDRLPRAARRTMRG
jgi:hypothetical protein